MADDKSEPPRVVAFDGPDQVERGSEIELRWTLAGGPPQAVKLDGHAVQGSSCKLTVVDDPTCYTLEVTNQAGTASAEKWVGTHEPGECVSDFVEITAPEIVKNPRWLRRGAAPGAGFAHGETAELVVDVARDGTPIRFVVEQERDGAWITYQELSDTSRGGKAAVQLNLAHPAAGARSAAAARHARFRFHAAVA